MTDNIRGTLQEKSGMYYAVISYYLDGKRKQKWIKTKLPLKNNKRKAELFLQQVLKSFETKQEDVKSEMLFSDYILDWLEINRSSWADKTYTGYKLIVENQICPFFKAKHLKISDLKPYHIQEYYDMKLKKDKVKGNTVMRHHAIIHKCLKYAAKLDVINSNPAEKVILPKVEKFRGSYYNSDEIKTLLDICKGTALETVILITSHYGLRRSETIGIKWSAINFEERTLSIENTIVQIPTGKGKTALVSSSMMKTDSSYRTLPLTDNVAKHLLYLKEKQDVNKKFFGDAYNIEHEDYICLFDDGKLISPNYVTKAFSKILSEHNLRKIRFHDLRHSCATVLLSLGFTMKEIQVWLGHNNLATTADIYSHVEYKSKVNLAEKLANAYA